MIFASDDYLSIFFGLQSNSDLRVLVVAPRWIQSTTHNSHLLVDVCNSTTLLELK